MKFLLLPGTVACQLAGLREESDHALILRMFMNTLFWGVLGTVAALTVVPV